MKHTETLLKGILSRRHSVHGERVKQPLCSLCLCETQVKHAETLLKEILSRRHSVHGERVKQPLCSLCLCEMKTILLRLQTLAFIDESHKTEIRVILPEINVSARKISIVFLHSDKYLNVIL